MTTPPSIPSWATKAAESLVEPVVCANSGGENEYTRLPTISEIAAGLVELRERWEKEPTQSGAEGATPLTDFSKLTEHARKVEKMLVSSSLDWAEDHTHLQKLCIAAGISPDKVHGDSFGVPAITDLADMLAARAATAAEKEKA